jgi:hypothetical protein
MDVHERFDAPWSPPADRHGAATVINELSHDITLILAQLAETAAEWCARTGRTEQDHAQWRRRALFAKAHKENQLRECKRLRQLFAAEQPAQESRASEVLGELEELRRLCKRAVAAWEGSPIGATPLDVGNALSALAAYLHEASARRVEERDLRGVRTTPDVAKAQRGVE